MRHDVRQVKKEWTILISLDKACRVLRDPPREACLIRIEFNHLFVVIPGKSRNPACDRVQWSIVVGIRQPHPFIKPAPSWQKRRLVTQVPLSVNRSGVATLLKEIAQQNFVRMDSCPTGVVQGTTHSDTVRITARHQRGTRRRADRLSHVEARQFCAITCQAINVRSLDVGGTVATDIAIPQIVRIDQHDVG